MEAIWKRSCFVLLLFISLPLCAADQAYLQALQQQAEERRLAQHAEWRALLHYKRDFLSSGYTSQADDPDFFNAPDGKTDPQAELAATLARFFAPPLPGGKKKQAPQCAFIARYHWLRRQLHFDSARLPPQKCEHFEAWFAKLNPEALTLVYPAAYLNNPSSMFGHTLLRIDRRDQDEQTRLLSHALSYAAATREESGLIFAVKGIFGGYSGLFSLLPYYRKVKKYSDLENRDIWEYQLNFTAEEIRRLLMHVWELDGANFDYYFFDENCSYYLLSLFDVARPGLDLSKRFDAWAIPLDTARAVAQVPGLLKGTVYRPSSATRLRHRLHLQPVEQRNQVKALAEGALAPADLDPLSAQTNAELLELAYDYLYYQNIVRRSGSRNKLTRRLRELLVARSRLRVSPAPGMPAAPRPDLGHDSVRLVAGIGREEQKYYQTFRLRPAYHDLLDAEAGYVRGAQINFMDLSLRRYPGSGRTELESLALLDIISLAPRDDFFKQWSWKINTGLTRRLAGDKKNALICRTNGGAGVSYAPTQNALWYGFLESNLDIGGNLDENYALGAGIRSGLFLDINQRWRLHLYAGVQDFFTPDRPQFFRDMGLEQRFSLNKSTALRVRFVRQRDSEGDTVSQSELSVHWYF